MNAISFDTSFDRLLKQTSRTFYLSLRFLPCDVRGILSLAYLLARGSDTIADAAEMPAATRLSLLRELPANGPASHHLSYFEGPERELIDAFPEMLAALDASSARDEILKTWQTIIQGQIFDLERFPSTEPLAKEELDRYTYLVAGCVGEFWNTICFRQIKNYTRERLETMQALGKNFGQGLQLVNILRDRQSDAAQGRIYVPPSRFDAEMQNARISLHAGEKYAAMVEPRRLRAACWLPLDLGQHTLDLIARNPGAGKRKISRGRVLSSFLLAWFR